MDSFFNTFKAYNRDDSIDQRKILTHICSILNKLDLLRQFYEPFEDSTVKEEQTIYLNLTILEGNFGLGQQ